MAMPKRNALKTIRYWLKRVCTWVAKNRATYVEWLEPEQVDVIDAMVVACNATVSVIDAIYP